MKENSNIVNFTTANLDFDDIANDLRNYMQHQTEFSDYQFTGSALNTLINVLAYNTHYNNIYDNFALNESFLDSAQKRQSVISHANLLNYIPRSAKSSTATVDFVITDPSYNKLDSVILPKYSIFNTTIEGHQYTFYTDATHTLVNNNGTYTAKNVLIRHGTYITIQQQYSGDSKQKFVLNNPNVDLDTLTVEVQHNDKLYTFRPVEKIVDVTDTSKVYFLSTDRFGNYQIQFGFGLMGMSLSAGDTIFITYLSCGNDPTIVNGANKFVYQGSPITLGCSSSATSTVITTNRSSGGSWPESTESIRQLAPKVYTTQNRCVTADDYKTTIVSEFANAKSVNVWGGEEMNPPQYNKVFISIIPKQGEFLSNKDKTAVRNILKNKKVITTLIEFVDPSKLSVNIHTVFQYDPDKTVYSKGDLETIVRNTILNFGDSEFGDFGETLRYSNLCTAIDKSDRSIKSNITKLRLTTNINPIYNTIVNYKLNLNNGIFRSKAPAESVLSSGFFCSEYPNRLCYIDDDPINQILRIFYIDKNNNKVILGKVGKVNYQTGELVIDRLTINGLTSGSWTFSFNPSNNDINANLNQFIVISDLDLIVSSQPILK